VSAALLAVLRTVLALQCVSKARGWTGHVARWLVPSLLLTAIAGVRLSPYEYNVEVLAPRCCCAALCCVAVLFSTPSLPRVLLVTALSLSVVVRVLREGARVTWVCWCWLLCCRGARGGRGGAPCVGVTDRSALRSRRLAAANTPAERRSHEQQRVPKNELIGAQKRGSAVQNRAEPRRYSRRAP
jgi:hypothetical protein